MSDRFEYPPSQRLILGAIAIAAVIQLPLTLFGGLFPMPNDLYGAPIPVGESCGICLWGGDSSFILPLWFLNVAVTTAVFYLVLRAGAPRSSVWAGVWGFLSVIVSYAMELGVLSDRLPFAGLPVPASFGTVGDGRPIHAIFLLDAVVWAGAYVWWRRHRLARM